MKVRWIILQIAIVILAGCSEIFEKNISKEEVQLITPGEDDTLNSGTVSFWWMDIEEATSYKLRIVEGTLQDPERLVLDTVVTKTVFEHTLVSGTYEWQVLAQNGSSETMPSSRVLKVDSTYDFSNERVQLKFPIGGDCLGDTVIVFEWFDLDIPNTTYTFDLRKGVFEDEIVLERFDLKDNFMSLALDPALEGELSWGVRIYNDQSASPFSSGSFYLDLTPPLEPNPVAPSDSDTITGVDVIFTWTSNPSGNCPITHTLKVYGDTLGNNLVDEVSVASSLSTYSATLSSGYYSWQMMATDGAGNQSNFTELISFYVE